MESAQSVESAEAALAALSPQFSDTGNAAVSSVTLLAQQDQALASGRGTSVRSAGDAEMNTGEEECSQNQ